MKIRAGYVLNRKNPSSPPNTGTIKNTNGEASAWYARKAIPAKLIRDNVLLFRAWYEDPENKVAIDLKNKVPQK